MENCFGNGLEKMAPLPVVKPTCDRFVKLHVFFSNKKIHSDCVPFLNVLVGARTSGISFVI